MKKIISMMFVLIILFSLSSIVFAEGNTVTIPESMLTDEQKQQIQQQNVTNQLETYGKWVGLGKEIGQAVDSSLGALTNRAEEFANTKVGKFTLFIVAYKVCGTDLIQLIIGIPLFIFMIIVWLLSFYRSCIPHKVVISKEGFFWCKKKTYELKGQDESKEGSQRWGYFFVLVLVIGICALVIFA